MQRVTTRKGISVREEDAPDVEGKSFAVLDDLRQERSRVVIRRVNDSLLNRRPARQVVRFSERAHSPRLSDEIWAPTLAHYREGEKLGGGQYDPMEGRVKMDATPLMARRLLKQGVDMRSASFEAQVTFGGSDPWVFCTAFCPVRERDAYRLARRISPEYDTITDILDVDAFALELGVDFAITLNPELHTKANSVVDIVQRALAANSGFEKIVHVHHGPVAYEDISGSLDTGREPFDLESRVGFTKPRSFSYQSEYRFVLWTIGEPSIRTLRIPVSDALRECTSIR